MYPRPGSATDALWLPPGGDEGAGRPLRDPTLWCLVALCVVVAGFALFRTDTRFAGAPKWYWMEKLVWPQDADVVVLGDSRVYRGVDPEAIAPGGVARNFGFSSAKLTDDYVGHAESLLDPAGKRVMIIGVSLFSIPGRSDAQEGFQDARSELAKLRLPMRVARATSEWELALEPIALDAGQPNSGANGAGSLETARALASEYQQVFHDSGWVESDREVQDPVAAGLATVRQSFPVGFATRADVSHLIALVRRLVADGVCVCAFRPPVPPEVAAFEDSIGFVEYKQLAESIGAAGGTWIDVDPTGLESYDGSHLDGPSARLLSERLGTAVRAACWRE